MEYVVAQHGSHLLCLVALYPTRSADGVSIPVHAAFRPVVVLQGGHSK